MFLSVLCRFSYQPWWKVAIYNIRSLLVGLKSAVTFRIFCFRTIFLSLLHCQSDKLVDCHSFHLNIVKYPKIAQTHFPYGTRKKSLKWTPNECLYFISFCRKASTSSSTGWRRIWFQHRLLKTRTKAKVRVFSTTCQAALTRPNLSRYPEEIELPPLPRFPFHPP